MFSANFTVISLFFALMKNVLIIPIIFFTLQLSAQSKFFYRIEPGASYVSVFPGNLDYPFHHGFRVPVRLNIKEDFFYATSHIEFVKYHGSIPEKFDLGNFGLGFGIRPFSDKKLSPFLELTSAISFWHPNKGKLVNEYTIPGENQFNDPLEASFIFKHKATNTNTISLGLDYRFRKFRITADCSLTQLFYFLEYSLYATGNKYVNPGFYLGGKFSVYYRF